MHDIYVRYVGICIIYALYTLHICCDTNTHIYTVYVHCIQYIYYTLYTKYSTYVYFMHIITLYILHKRYTQLRYSHPHPRPLFSNATTKLERFDLRNQPEQIWKTLTYNDTGFVDPFPTECRGISGAASVLDSGYASNFRLVSLFIAFLLTYILAA